MTGLIEEIQRDALDPNIPVTTILRKVKVAASKLSLPNLEDWVQMELTGYNGELPSYRQLYGRPMAHNPYQGWIPIMMASDEDQNLLSEAPISQAISSLEDLIDRSKSGFVQIEYPAAVIRLLNQQLDIELGRMANHLSITQIQSIINTVRNMALDWAVRMEQRGIIGEGLTFNASEKEQAKSAMNTFNVGNIGQFIGALGSGNTTGDISASQSAQSDEIFDRLIDIAKQQVELPADQVTIISAIEDMRASKNERAAYARAYSSFIGSIADHMAVFSPYVTQLGALLG
ncbi:hypothetical protein JHC09_08340 [Devosia sp. MC532]|uniref:AbiTii domain-containing protein n=1 Tax=Devosia sp. MC532 TaxID=2799788 RepID=UPI0018F3817C|nr:hypothetical protein [Devosia sp. MC532]